MILQNISNIVSQPLYWFETLCEASGTMGFILSTITLVLAVRFIIIPLTGGVIARGQDRVDFKKGRGKYAVTATSHYNAQTGKSYTTYSQRRR